MKAFVCEMCGSQELVKQDGMYVCQHCGTKYAPEEAKKLMVELSGSVEIDNSKKLENLYVLARRAKDEGNSEDGAKYYGYFIENKAMEKIVEFKLIIEKGLWRREILYFPILKSFNAF